MTDEKIQQSEVGYLLNKLGERVAELYDLDTLSFYGPAGNPRLEQVWKRFLAKQLNDLERQNKAIQYALEILLHNILFCLQEQREFRIQAQTRSGQWVNIDEYSDGIHGDFLGWLEQKSKYGCVSTELIKIETEE